MSLRLLAVLLMGSTTAYIVGPPGAGGAGLVAGGGVEAGQNTTETKSVMLIVQGPRKSFQKWQTIMAWLSDFPVILVYGTYDHPAGDCENNDRYRCITRYMPNTTWTEGRNALTKVALCDEEKRGEQSSYFVYSDDDVSLTCEHVNCTREQAWRRYMHILTNVMPHTGSPVMAMDINNWHLRGLLPRVRPSPTADTGVDPLRQSGGHGDHDVARAQPHPSPDGPFFLTDAYDAIINAFDRRFLPLLLPYATLPHATSEWHSQAIHFLVMFACFGQSAVVPTSLRVANAEHRPYQRGLNTTLINIVAQDSYSSYIELKTEGFDYSQFRRKEGPFMTVGGVKNRVSFHMTNQLHDMSKLKGCSPLNRRFNEWKDSTSCLSKCEMRRMKKGRFYAGCS